MLGSGMNQSQIKTWFQSFAKEIIQQQEYLSDLDNAIGDGDHGYNMAKGLQAYLDAREGKEDLSVAGEFKLLGMTLLGKVGGASGPIYSSAFLAMAKHLDGITEIDAHKLSELLDIGLQAIVHRGKATVGEKTLVDVWTPIVEDMKNQQLTKEGITGYVEQTKAIKATKGRASYLGERSIGHVDPGSCSSGILFETMLDAMLL